MLIPRFPNFLLCFFLFSGLLGGLVTTGCAYNFTEVKRSFPSGYDQVAVPIFKNLTMEPGAEAFFTRAMIVEIERAHKARVAEKNVAQLIVDGTITNIDVLMGAPIDPTPYLPTLPAGASFASEYRVMVKVTINLRRKSDDKILWGGVFQGESRYGAPLVTNPIINSADAVYNQSAREQTIQSLSQDMMAEAHDRITENF